MVIPIDHRAMILQMAVVSLVINAKTGTHIARDHRNSSAQNIQKSFRKLSRRPQHHTNTNNGDATTSTGGSIERERLMQSQRGSQSEASPEST